jgi:carbon-monoxide dehydrogenase large subunit
VRALTGEDVAKVYKPYRGILLHYTGMKTGAMLPLAVDRVRNVGEPVVAIAATDRARAEDATRSWWPSTTSRCPPF